MDLQLTIITGDLLRIVSIAVLVIIVAVWALIRSLFRYNFARYRKWIEDEVYADWRDQLRALREHYDELLDALQEHYDEVLGVYDVDRITLAKQVKLLGDRLAVQEEIFDRVMEGVILASSVSIFARRTKEKVRQAIQRSRELKDEWKKGKP